MLRLALAHELVDPAGIAQPDVDIPMRIHPAAMARPSTIKARQYLPGRIEDADPCRGIIHAALADDEHAVAVDGDIHRPLDIGPQFQKFPIEIKDLKAVVLAVADVDLFMCHNRGCGAGGTALERFSPAHPRIFLIGHPR